MPQLPHSPFDSDQGRPDLTGRGVRGLALLRLSRHTTPAPPSLLASRQARQAAAETLLRMMASQSQLSAPADFSTSLRESLSRVSMDSPAPGLRNSMRDSMRVSDIPVVLGDAWTHASTLAHYRDLSERQRRVALGGAGTLGMALLCLLGLALDPGDMVALLSIVGAVMVALLAVGHLLSATVATVLGSGVFAAVAIALYVGFAALWVRLVRRPIEA